MNYKKEKTIKCPSCGCEYLPAEIFLPNEFLGRPKQIEKEHMTGRVMDYMGTGMNLKETYICDRCDTPFKIVANVNFNTYKENEPKHKTVIKKEKLFLNEA